MNARDLNGTAQSLVCGKFEVFIGVDCIKLFCEASILDRNEGLGLWTVLRSFIGRYRTELHVVVRHPVFKVAASPADVRDSQHHTKKEDRS